MAFLVAHNQHGWRQVMGDGACSHQACGSWRICYWVIFLWVFCVMGPLHTKQKSCCVEAILVTAAHAKPYVYVQIDHGCALFSVMANASWSVWWKYGEICTANFSLWITATTLMQMLAFLGCQFFTTIFLLSCNISFNKEIPSGVPAGSRFTQSSS